ncbi:hypothetical protein LINGRAHAP2_LOCUS15527 [Linum grandiflorum]
MVTILSLGGQDRTYLSRGKYCCGLPCSLRSLRSFGSAHHHGA